MSRFGRSIRPFIQSELDAARRAMQAGDPPREFARLERAHVLGQTDTWLHVRVHVCMLMWGLRQHSAREVAGQVIRILGAATKTALGLVPHGNSGGSRVNPWRRMPIAPELQALITSAGG